MATPTPTRRRFRRLAGRNQWWYEKAVSTGSRWHRLQPDALLGTLRCDPTNSGTYPLEPGPSKWAHVARIPVQHRCPGCWS